MAVNVSEFCTQASSILQFVGWVLTFFKIGIPLVIIAYGMVDFGKAVVASEDNEIKNQTRRLLYRALAGVVIFFIPTLVMWIFGAISEYNDSYAKANFDMCKTCVLSPWDCS
ncbi:MAG: hypothetical protein PHD03_01535 [Bacilli bacterium]|nr:hypothetical protein [Bacilli bacterium]MDD4407237.1 hypothetical protein [Bacilli bacterium]